MRGRTARQVTMLTVTPDELIPAAHPMRRVKPIAEAALRRLEPCGGANTKWLYDQQFQRRRLGSNACPTIAERDGMRVAREQLSRDGFNCR